MIRKLENCIRGIGRRKEAIAIVELVPGTGQFQINGLPYEIYLQQNPQAIAIVSGPILIKQAQENVDIIQEDTSVIKTEWDTFVKVRGGGLSGQADAIRLGLSRAFLKLSFLKPLSGQLDRTLDNTLLKLFKDKGFLTQDSRVKERRKYGLKKARKASQYHKR